MSNITFQIQSGRSFAAGQWVLAQSRSAPSAQIYGQVVSYSGTSLVVTPITTGGSGTHNDWIIVLANSPAAAGYQPPVGTGNVTGPGSSTAGHIAIYADGTGKVLAEGGAPAVPAGGVSAASLVQSAAAFGLNMLNGALVVTASAGALTVAVKTLAGADPSVSDPVWFVFRSGTATSGTPTVIAVTAALSATLPASNTLGFNTNTPGRVWIVAANNAGTVTLGLINCLSGTSIYPLGGWGIAAFSPFSGGASAAQAFYWTPALATVAYSVIGYASWEAPVTMTAGTWVAPSRIENYRPGVPLPGTEIQKARNATGAANTGTTTVANTDTIPTSSAGTQFMSQAITPTSSANLLAIEHQGHYSEAGTATDIIAFLLQDAVANALAASMQETAAVTANVVLVRLLHVMLAATLSSTTFKINAGASTAGTVTFNGVSSARILGGVFNSFLEAREIMA